MESYRDQIFDSPSMNSYIGSYYQPPDRLLPQSYANEATTGPPMMNTNLLNISPHVSRTVPDAGSKAVIAALKTLQEKIRRLEQERKQAERNVKQFSQTAHSSERSAAATTQSHPPINPSETDLSRKKEMVTQLQSAEARCELLEKQLDYMKKMVENAEKDKNNLIEKQASLQKQKQKRQNTSDAQSHHEKLEKLEQDCLKLNKTQSLAGRKIELLEKKILEEEHERKLVQEKADELQRELEINLRLCSPVIEEVKPKKKPKSASRKSSLTRHGDSSPPSLPKAKQLPFVAGTSTSPSHSIHANMQSVLHMMKHHQPQLCERVRSMHRSGCAARKGLHKTLLTSSTPRGQMGPRHAAPLLGSLSDLLLALQDELGQMSFEHQELVRHINETRRREHRDDLERELEVLVKRMGEKGAQITKLRKHEQTVHILRQKPRGVRQQALSDDDRPKVVAGIRPPFPSPVRTSKMQAKRGGVSQENLQLLRQTQMLRSSLKKDDITWET
ncbi:centrosomal protein CEP57L1 [Aplochiton taeniatus]